jgi:hypothetical protein
MKTEFESHEFENLVAKIKATRMAAQLTPAPFRSSLRAHLLSQYTAPIARPTYRWLYVPAAIVLVVAALAYVVLGSTLGVSPVSAAKVLQKANAIYLSRAAGDVIYDRMLIDLHTDLVNQHDIIGEFWQSVHGDQFRFQLVSQNGELLYFAQRNGSRVWRSYHTQPVGSGPVPWIYTMTIDQYRVLNLSGLDDPLNTPVLGRTTGLGWLALENRITALSQPCSDLFCVLGLTGREWQCSKDRCILLEAGKPAYEAVLSTHADTENVYTVEIRTIPASDVTQVVQINAQTYALIEVASYRNGQLVSRLRPVEWKSMAISDLQPDFFSSIPEGMQLQDFGTSQPTAPFDRIWVIAVSPQPGTNLTEQSDLRITLGYDLVTRDQALLHVMLWPAFPWSGGLATDGVDQTLTAGIGVVDVVIPVAAATSHKGIWGLKATLGYVTETKELKILADMNWGEYQWCISCEDKNAP